MKIYNKHLFLLRLFILVVASACVESFDTDTEIEITDALVVDARLTTQNSQQSILLSRTFAFDSSTPKPETEANVIVRDDSGTVITFSEVVPGKYTSISIIQLVPGRKYQLEITTKEGLKYISDYEEVPSNVEIEEVTASRVINNSDIEGVSILVNSSNNNSSPSYFRYEFEETYKLVAPEFNPFDWDEVDYDFFCEDDDGWEVTTAARDEPARICYATSNSNDIILSSTENLSSNNLENFEVRFLSRENYRISHRYSILVKQYHHSVNAASFYKSLEDFSSEESIFSNTQTGFLEGNINFENSNALVLGFFELSSYSEKRMFFNYEDLFPDEPLPPYIINCFITGKPALYPEGFHATVINGKVVLDGNDSSPLIEGILSGAFGYHAENDTYLQLDENGDEDRAPFLIKARGCVDCRVFGENVMPEYWEE